MAKEKTLTPKQREFIRQYLLCRNGVQAAKRAGYKGNDKTLKQVAHENLQRPEIAAEIAAGEVKAQEKFAITQEAILNELAIVGFGNIANMVDEDGKIHDPDKASFLTSISKSSSYGPEVNTNTFSMSNPNKVKALELLGKHVGMWKEANAGSGTDNAARLDVINRVRARIRKDSGPGGAEGANSP